MTEKKNAESWYECPRCGARFSSEQVDEETDQGTALLESHKGCKGPTTDALIKPYRGDLLATKPPPAGFVQSDDGRWFPAGDPRVR